MLSISFLTSQASSAIHLLPVMTTPRPKGTTTGVLHYTSERNLNDYPQKDMNHSFFVNPLTIMLASSKQARQCFIILAVVTMHQPH